MKLFLLFGAGAIAVGSAAFTYYQDADPVAGENASRAATELSAAGFDEVATPMWRRPAGPPRVALQAGHWKSHEAPDEQAGLRNNGTRGGGKQEWEVNLEIAQRAARLLEAKGYVVDVLPTTVPPGYWADLFISIHADGSASSSASGYRAAAPRRDATGRAEEFVRLLERTYGDVTGLPYYPTVTRRMRGYYAFNYRRYDHAIHPMTTGVIIETGFLTSPRDRSIIVSDPDRPAKGIADAVELYLATIDLDAPLAMPSYVPRARLDRALGD